MSYKDEYEVARLHMQTGFEDRLREEFEGDFKVNYHMSPPVLPLGKDARGRPNKVALGPWMRPVLGRLAKMKGLRGGVFDPFRFSVDRKLDRALLTWFEGVLDLVADRYSADTLEVCAALVSAPSDIRGYGPVREKAAQDVRVAMQVHEDALRG